MSDNLKKNKYNKFFNLIINWNRCFLTISSFFSATMGFVIYKLQSSSWLFQTNFAIEFKFNVINPKASFLIAYREKWESEIFWKKNDLDGAAGHLKLLPAI